MQYHKYSLTELEDMIPWEREIYVEMLMQHIKEENEKIREKQRGKELCGLKICSVKAGKNLSMA